MNAGLAIATGEVTVILDADSELSEDALWRIVQPLAILQWEPFLEMCECVTQERTCLPGCSHLST